MIKNMYKTLILVLFLNLIIGCSSKKEEAKTNSNTIPTVVVTNVKAVEYSEQIKTTGRVSFNNEYKLSFKNSGIVNAVYVKAGQKVKAGTVLATLKQDEIRAKTTQAKISYDKAKRDYDRTKALYNDKVATLEQLENAESQMKNMQQSLQVAQFNKGQSKIIAPTNGIVQKILVEANEVTGAGNPILIFGSGSQGKVLVATIADVDAVKVKPEDKASLSFDAWSNTNFNGKLLEVAGMANNKTGTYEVKIQVNDPDYQLKSGFIGQANITSSIVNKWIEIPIESLVQANKKIGVVYKVENNLAIKQQVQIAKITNDKLLISKGLSEKDRVVIEGFNQLKGNRISVKTSY